MILARRPVTIYDVDVLFLGGIAAGLALLYVGLAAPLTQQAQAAAVVRAQLRGDQQRLAEMRDALRRVEQDSEQLRTGIQARASHLPRLRQYNETISAIVALAAGHGAEVASIVPGQPQRLDERYASELQLGGRARFADFISFLDQLAREHAYYQLESLALQSAGGGGETPVFSLTIRLFLLPDRAASPETPQ